MTRDEFMKRLRGLSIGAHEWVTTAPSLCLEAADILDLQEIELDAWRKYFNAYAYDPETKRVKPIK